ncbi:MAG: hypothetical protein ACWGQW_05080 [bacterium]
MTIEKTAGGTIITGDDIGKVRLLTLRRALSLELKGLRMSRNRSAFGIVRQEFSLTGTRKEIFKKFNALVTEQTGVPYER